MMSQSSATKPKLVWVISALLGLMATLNIGILSWLLLNPWSSSAENVRAALSLFDWMSLYGCSVVLLASMVFLFRMRSRSIPWLISYIGLGSWTALWYSFTPRMEPHFHELASLAGILVALAVLGYMVRLKAQEALA